MLSFFPLGVLDEILNLIESVSEGFPSYFCYGGRDYMYTSVRTLLEYSRIIDCPLHRNNQTAAGAGDLDIIGGGGVKSRRI